ncbi:flocculation-associated PEP-CTERM protein PepA [Thermoproteota archaeon]
MVRKSIALIAVACVCFLAVPGQASATMFDWSFNPDGTGLALATGVSEFLDYTGLSYIVNHPDGTFEGWGAFDTEKIDGIPISGYTNEVTSVLYETGLSTSTGFAIQGGWLNVYSDSANDYGSTNGFFGADNGLLIGSFLVVGGGGSLSGFIPNGTANVFILGTSLASGYWYDDTGVDMSSYVSLQNPWLTGLATTNASLLTNPNQLVLDEWAELLNVTGGLPFTPPGALFLSNNGQLRLHKQIPEPASLVLLGSGLLGLAGFRRKKKS